MIRRLVSIGALVAALIASYYVAVLPYHCNVALKTLEQRTGVILPNSDTEAARLVATRTIERLHHLPSCCRDLAQYRMLEGVSYRIVRDRPAALAAYRIALAHERRPETFLNLGYAEVESGDQKAALEHFVAATRFDPFFITSMPDSVTREDVEKIVFDQSNGQLKLKN